MDFLLALVIGEESRNATRFLGIPVEGSGMGQFVEGSRDGVLRLRTCLLGFKGLRDEVVRFGLDINVQLGMV